MDQAWKHCKSCIGFWLTPTYEQCPGIPQTGHLWTRTTTTVLEEVLEGDVISGWPGSWTWEVRGSPPLLCLWNVCSAHHSQSLSRFKDATLRVRCCWVHLSHLCDWASLRSPCKVKILKVGCGDLLVLQPLDARLLCKFPCLLLKLPLSNQEWSASLISPCPPGLGPVWFPSGEFLRLPTNTQLPFFYIWDNPLSCTWKIQPMFILIKVKCN